MKDDKEHKEYKRIMPVKVNRLSFKMYKLLIDELKRFNAPREDVLVMERLRDRSLIEELKEKLKNVQRDKQLMTTEKSLVEKYKIRRKHYEVDCLSRVAVNYAGSFHLLQQINPKLLDEILQIQKLIEKELEK